MQIICRAQLVTKNCTLILNLGGTHVYRQLFIVLKNHRFRDDARYDSGKNQKQRNPKTETPEYSDFEIFPNPNIRGIYPFTSLQDEIVEILNKKGIHLYDKKTEPTY